MARIDRANAEQESYSLDDWFTTFGAGLSPSQPGRHALVMLTSYMDDSGSERKGPVFVLAGYISVPEIWEQTFSPAWAECLAKPPALEYFKMAEAHRLHDAFRGWSAAQRDERLANLTRVVGQQRIMTAQVFALVWDDFQRALDDYPHVKGAYPYDALFHGVLAHTTQRLVDHKLAHQVDFVFDEQGSAGQRAILTYHAIKGAVRGCLRPTT